MNDFVDQCEGTPTGLDVNTVGCADIDGDGVFANVDDYSGNLQTVELMPSAVPWCRTPLRGHASSLDRPMQVVPQFTFPTLNGTFNFNNRWTGHDVYFFMFKYTDANGNSNAATWGQTPGNSFGIFPSIRTCSTVRLTTTYHNDVIQQRNAVLAGLTTSEEAHWDDRIHYIDIDASNLGGGIGNDDWLVQQPVLYGHRPIPTRSRKRDPSTLGRRNPTTPTTFRLSPTSG